MGPGFLSFGDLDAVAEDAAGALDRARRPSLYDRLDWFRLLARHCPPEGRLRVLRAGDAWLFLAVRGRHAAAYASWYSLRVGPVGEASADAMTSLAEALRASGVATLDLAPIEDPAPLAAALRRAGWIVRSRPDKANWIARVAGLDFDTYWSRRPGRLRNTARRKAKTADLEIEIHEHFNEDAWRTYEQVYEASWKPEEGSFPFLRALAEQEGAAGTLRLGIARHADRAVAAQLWITENGTATIHKLAYDETAKAGSPGTLLSMAMFRHAIEKDRVALIDYGTGDEPYKRDWMDERRTLWRLAAYDRRTLSGLAGAARAALSALVARARSR